MFRAVVCRAVADAYGKTGLEDQSERRTAIREAREFFHRQDEDFTLVFSCAGIDPKPILAHMLTLSPDDYYKSVDSGGNEAHMSTMTKPKPRRKH